jgi:hypothetical protein
LDWPRGNRGADDDAVIVTTNALQLDGRVHEREHSTDHALGTLAHAGLARWIVRAAVRALDVGMPATRATATHDGDGFGILAGRSQACGVPRCEVVTIAPVATLDNSRMIEVFIARRFGTPPDALLA